MEGKVQKVTDSGRQRLGERERERAGAEEKRKTKDK